MNSSRQDNNKRVFLVTGDTGAIGKAIARQLAEIEDSEGIGVP